MRLSSIAAAVIVCQMMAVPLPAEEPFRLSDGDRVVLVGSTLIERAQQYGYLETLLTARWPRNNVTFRNLGYSGDTVFAHARAGFDTEVQGFERLKELSLGFEPTVVVLGYGTNAAFEDEAGLSRFTEGYNRLLDTLGVNGPRWVMFSPLKLENLGPPLPDPADHNRSVRLYCDAIQQLAQQREGRYVDLFQRLGPPSDAPPEIPLTDNGMHLTPYGYWRMAAAVEDALGLAPRPWHVTIDIAKNGDAVDGQPRAEGTQLSRVSVSEGTLLFTALDESLPVPLPPEMGRDAETRAAERPTSDRETDVADVPASAEGRLLRVTGMTPGSYSLRLDGQQCARADAAQWAKGVMLREGAPWQRVERLREAIVAKNRFYFHRWRPQNTTYLLGFRKHEQGQNAVELEEFDKLVAEQEARIARLRLPVEHHYELIRDVADQNGSNQDVSNPDEEEAR
jgi:lysophospholipase L1-like esterase